jgi:hypothetical protein
VTRRACDAGRGSYRGTFVHKYFGSRSASRTRVRDLVDMVLLIQFGTLTNDKVAEAIGVTFKRRKTHASPNALPLPPAQWQKPYEALARECGISGQLEDTFAVLRIFLKPILGG